ncbi:MAG: ADP-ribosyltransferase [Elusimicrobiales bacterium]|nr:ADP-ribosyltransferase [Elusimicrobiales bacterium]
MGLFINLLAGCLLASAIAVNASAELSFDSRSAGLSFAADLVPAAVPLAAPAGAHTYDFKSLYRSLGYPSANFFGSSEDEVMSLEAYISKEDPIYNEINGYLRYHPQPYTWYGTGPDDAKVIVGHLDKMLRRAPQLPGDLVLFRGLGLGYRQDKPFETGEEFTDKGYVSTSVTYSVARYFAMEMVDEEKPDRRAVFALYFAGPGERGLLIDQGEDEVMLGHGRKFRVMARKDGLAKYDLYLVQVCAASCDTTLRGDVNDFWNSFSVSD